VAVPSLTLVMMTVISYKPVAGAMVPVRLTPLPSGLTSLWATSAILDQVPETVKSSVVRAHNLIFQQISSESWVYRTVRGRPWKAFNQLDLAGAAFDRVQGAQ
jgi:hypothetical protein